MPAQPNADAGAGRAGRDDRAPPQPAASPVDGEAFADTAAQLRSPSDAPPPHAPLDEAASGAAGPAAMPGAAAAGAGAAVAAASRGGCPLGLQPGPLQVLDALPKRVQRRWNRTMLYRYVSGLIEATICTKNFAIQGLVN